MLRVLSLMNDRFMDCDFGHQRWHELTAVPVKNRLKVVGIWPKSSQASSPSAVQEIRRPVSLPRSQAHATGSYQSTPSHPISIIACYPPIYA
jgi:hypothetical protein